ncbi:MAG: glycosyltransferase family 2 protein [Pelolinea sp.]|nr:glycosyltransferase family 2 protein [Pelolinea sp.]
MPKLIIQIPCFNEEKSLPVTLKDLPRKLPGLDKIEWLIIDDGSTDRTVEVARSLGVDHVVRLIRHQGLAKGFMAGIRACVEYGADIIVNTDADNQYYAGDIIKLVQPILDGKAEIVIGERPITEIKHFSPLKKLFQRWGSWMVRKVSQTDIPDAPSGFRAISREAAMRMHVFSEYTYTIETIIQAGQHGMAIMSVPIRTNDFLRKSRLIHSIPAYLARSFNTILRIFMTYKPLSFFMIPGSVSFLIGTVLGLRFLYFYLVTGTSSGHMQSLILVAVLLILGVFLVIVGLIADLISVNRKLLENVDYRLQRLDEKVEKLRKE